MRTTIIAILLIVLTSIITGCKSANDQGTPGDASAAPTTAQTFDLGELSYIFEIPAESVDVALTLDTAATVEALIPVEGGTISATGADGTVYTLVIPADALLNETMISLTPVTSVADMPFGDEQTYAVQLGPDGLFLQNFAVLTITPAVEIPIEEQIVFGYLKDGKDLILAAPVVDSSEIQIQVLHFSGNGVTKGLLADIEPVRQRLGGDIERRLENVVGRALIHKRQGADVSSDFFAEAFRQYEDQVVKPRVAAAGESCAAGQLALQTVIHLAALRHRLGLGEQGDPLDKYPGLLDTATQVCVIEEFQLCVEKHVIHRMIPVWRGFERLYALHGKGSTADNAVLREARDLTVLCLTFRLEFESTALFNEGLAATGSDEWETIVTSEIILRFNPDNGTISGEAPLVNEHHEFTMANPRCTVVSITGGGGPLHVYQLKYFAPIYDDLGPVSDIELAYLTGSTSESSSYICPANVSGENTLPFWSPIFFFLHYDEWDESYYLDELRPSVIMFVSTDWEIFGDEYFARKEWLKEDGEMVEGGTFELYHIPGQ